MPDTTDAEGLTVGQVSTRLGVTVRALHHWDETFLARPSLRTARGYRLYTAGDLERLERIVVYREAGLPLRRIREILDNPAADVAGPLRVQRTLLTGRIDLLQQSRDRLDRMIEAHERGVLLSDRQQAEIFGPQWNPGWSAQARQRYGGTKQWQQYAEGSAASSAADWQVVAADMASFEAALGDAMDAGMAPGSPEADQLLEWHREVFSSYFPLSRQMQVCLGRRFDADPDFAAYYDSIRPGLAAWFRCIIDAGARAHGIDPDTATWQ